MRKMRKYLIGIAFIRLDRPFCSLWMLKLKIGVLQEVMWCPYLGTVTAWHISGLQINKLYRCLLEDDLKTNKPFGLHSRWSFSCGFCLYCKITSCWLQPYTADMRGLSSPLNLGKKTDLILSNKNVEISLYMASAGVLIDILHLPLPAHPGLPSSWIM